MYVPLQAQLRNIRKWNNERAWGFENKVFDGLSTDIDLHPDRTHGRIVDMLAVYLEAESKISGVQRTFDELSRMALWQHPAGAGWESSLSGPANLSLVEGVHIPGIRRVMVNLGAHWDGHTRIQISQVRNSRSAGPEVLAAAAHFPEWLQALGTKAPRVWLCGYQMAPAGDGIWNSVPFIFRGFGPPRLEIRPYYELNFSSDFASPEIVPWPMAA